MGDVLSHVEFQEDRQAQVYCGKKSHLVSCGEEFVLVKQVNSWEGLNPRTIGPRCRGRVEHSTENIMEEVRKMAVQTLTALNTSSLRSLAIRCGSASSGSKPVVASQLLEIAQSRLSMNAQRVLSIDMGIKNIGVCEITITEERPIVHKWLLESISPHSSFAYPEFSTEAINLLNRLLGAQSASTAVIIERQRTRSNGSPSIFNDILRVNVLEGMLFAGIQAKWPHVGLDSVNPRHVLAFWQDQLVLLDSPEVSGKKKMSAYRLAKLARLNLVREWLAHPATAPVEFAKSFEHPESKKRDDLNDSLVQAVSWAQWLHNSRVIVDTIASEGPEGVASLASQTGQLLISNLKC